MAVVKKFFKDWKEKGFKYAFAVKFMFFYEKIPFHSIKRKVENICGKMYDYAYNIDYSDERLEEDDIRINECTEASSTPCGCTIFNDCKECSCYNLCSN